MKEELLFYEAYEQFYTMADTSKAFKGYCKDAFGADFSQDGFSDLSQIDTVLSYIPKRSNLHILDIGCGNGKMLRYLQEKTGAYICGFDYSDQAIQTAIAQRDATPMQNDIEFMQSNVSSDFATRADFRVGVIGEIEYPAESFDVVTSIDSIYFAKDMSAFVGQVRTWLKTDGVFVIGYQEGDVMLKTKNSETTVLAQALRENGLSYEVTDITQDTYLLLKKKRESALKFEIEFAKEGYTEWFDMLIGQTECVNVPFEAYREKNARYLFRAWK